MRHTASCRGGACYILPWSTYFCIFSVHRTTIHDDLTEPHVHANVIDRDRVHGAALLVTVCSSSHVCEGNAVWEQKKARQQRDPQRNEVRSHLPFHVRRHTHPATCPGLHKPFAMATRNPPPPAPHSAIPCTNGRRVCINSVTCRHKQAKTHTRQVTTPHHTTPSPHHTTPHRSKQHHTTPHHASTTP